MRVRGLIISFLVAVFLVSGAAVVSAKKPARETASSQYEKARKVYRNFIHSDYKKELREEWNNSISHFKKVLASYPHSYFSYKASYMLGVMYSELYDELGKPEDLDNALSYYQRLISQHPSDRLNDDALYRSGDILIKKNDYAAANKAFNAILVKYPKGDQYQKARKRLVEIGPMVKLQLSDEPVSKAANSYNKLNKIEYTVERGITRITVNISGPVEFKHDQLKNPDRIFFDFKNTKLQTNLPRKVDVEGNILHRLRVSQFDRNTSRLVLDARSLEGVNLKTRYENSQLVIELKNKNWKMASVKNIIEELEKIETDLEKIDAPSAPVPPKVKPVKKVAVKSFETASLPPVKKAVKKKYIPLIVIDPGHGGVDDGATSRGGLLEKNVNLKISKNLKKILEKKYKYRVRLTRDDDTFIPLDERGDVANQLKADLFISIHANASERGIARGIETYYLGTGSNERALETAARENGKLVESVNDDQVQKILASLISTTKINDSSRLAGGVQRRLHKNMSKKYSKVVNLGVKEGPFFVLHDSNMPSILIEVGFISNRSEERRLKSSKYLYRLSTSIAIGIHDYLKEKAPTI